MKIKLKPDALKSSTDLVDLGRYKWPNAYLALKAYYIFCFYRMQSNAHSKVVSKDFVTDIINGIHDYSFDALRPVLRHPDKKQLAAINCITFNDLLRIKPELMAGVLM